jgi:hypothetical protein
MVEPSSELPVWNIEPSEEFIDAKNRDWRRRPGGSLFTATGGMAGIGRWRWREGRHLPPSSWTEKQAGQTIILIVWRESTGFPDGDERSSGVADQP